MTDNIPTGSGMSELNSVPELTRAERSYVMVGYMLAFQDFMLKPHNSKGMATKIISSISMTAEKHLPIDVAPVIAQLVQEKGDRPTIAMLNTMADIAKATEKMSFGDKEYV
jgi:D-arabinose 1-dehydrogenase-like Zn-dependent alcohol dehydrogenase